MTNIDATVPTSDPLLGRTIDNYRILEVLGRGGMGVVYKGRDITLDRPVAIKMMDARLLAWEQHRKRFEVEARALARLKHENIVDIYALRQTEFGLMIVMEFVRGQSLQTFIKESAPVSVTRAVEIVGQVLRGLHHAHQQGIVHRDVKPANVLFDEQGKVKITDFGLAKLTDATALTQAGSTMGSPAYMSPEQVRGEEVDRRSDIWSTGVLLYELLAGKAPFSGTEIQAIQYQITNADPRSLRQDRPEIPDWLNAMVSRCMTRERDNRPVDCAEILDEFSTRLGQPALKVERTRAALVPMLGARRGRVLAFAAVVVVAVAALVFLLEPILGPKERLAVETDTGGAAARDALAMGGPGVQGMGPEARSVHISEIVRLGSADAFAAHVADRLTRIPETASGPMTVVPFLFQDTGFGDQFSLLLKNLLEARLAAAGRWTVLDTRDLAGYTAPAGRMPDETVVPGFYVRGTYWRHGDSVRVLASAVRMRDRAILATAEAILPGREIRRMQLEPGSLARVLREKATYKADAVPATGSSTPGAGQSATTSQRATEDDILPPKTAQRDLQVDLWTNKGKEGLIFTEGDTIEVHVRANKPCYVRMVYHLADGRRILPTGKESYRLERGAATPLERTWMFECSPPFGAEFLHVFASTAAFENVDVAYEEGYWVLNGGTKEFVAATRGIKPLQPGVFRAEAALTLTTLPGQTLQKPE